MKRGVLFLSLICLASFSALAQKTERRQAEAIRVSKPVKIDGVLDEDIWDKANTFGDFLQFRPNTGEPSAKKTEVKLVYDDHALYIGAILYDSPENIFTELTERDKLNGNTDYLAVTLLPFNDGLNAYQFRVSAADVQVDEKTGSGGFNKAWDAVWRSKAKIVDNGWIVEMEIPYSEFRFPKKDIQNWGFNVWRYAAGIKEWSTFNLIDRKKGSVFLQAGELHGIKNIKPPLRLSLTPYFSNTIEKNKETSNWKNKIGGGLDVKYGISESFTLDMILIPDFTEVESDDQILNLSPYETKFEEKRQFFTEGTELFEKGDIFYSKRIGQKPSGHRSIKNALSDGNYNEIKENPIESSLINATKISGRTSKGLGVGFFNAMTSNTYAEVVDSNNVERKVLTEPFTNYNMLVLDQNFKNNSYLSFINTNVWQERNKYMANVTGTDFKFENNDNSYALKGSAILSQKYYDTESDDFGHHLFVDIAKIKGNLRYGIGHLTESDDYDPNDMGYLRNNNKFYFNGRVEYNIFEPFWNILTMYNELKIEQRYLYAPREYLGTVIDIGSSTTFKNQWVLDFDLRWNPRGYRDYFFARVPGKMVRRTQWLNSTLNLTTDKRKMFSMSIKLKNGRYFGRYKNLNEKAYSIELTPELRLNNKLTLTHNFVYGADRYFKLVNNSDPDHIYFGKGRIPVINNTFTTKYVFNNKSSFSFRMRHYWSRADYKNFYELKNDGYIAESDYTGSHNISYNAFNVDFVYKWRFAPGSELSLVWKTAIDERENIIRTNSFGENLENTLDLPSASSFSVKLLYYLDWKKLKKRG